MTRRPWFWIVFVLVSAATVLFSVRNFPQAFPIVSLNLRMDRAAALDAARALAGKHGWGPGGSFRQAASFGVDDTVRTFVELAGGGKEAFRDMMARGLYEAYTWRARLFREGEKSETTVRFTPAGEPYGFVESLPEDAPGPALSEADARRLAEEQARSVWGVDLSAFAPVEASKEVKPGGRVDHTFVYERAGERAGDGRYRLRLVVGGDRLTELTHYLKVPEGFSRRYAEMRSANESISFGALAAAIALYFVLGGGFGLFRLLRERWVLWKAPLMLAAGIALLQALAEINAWPLSWMTYDTALPGSTFFMQKILTVLVILLVTVIYLSISFMAAESLSRRAFPHHPQLWKVWSKDAASSVQVLGRTAGGYLYTGLELAYIVGFYLITTRLFSWWVPSEALVDPDILSHYLPWLSAVAPSLHAGVWEECLFRAVPIAGAALLGSHFGHRKVWIGAALIVQALVFGGGHAAYASEPAYSRLVELILPAFIWGLVYLAFGLLPTIITHYVFDLALFSIPLFTASSVGARVGQAMVILCGLVPLAIVLVARWRAGAFRELPAFLYNRAWTPPPAAEEEPGEAAPGAVPAGVRSGVPAGVQGGESGGGMPGGAAGSETEAPGRMAATGPTVPGGTSEPLLSRTRGLSRPVLAGVSLLGLAGLAIWILVGWTLDAPRMSVGRARAGENGVVALRQRGFTPEPRWKEFVTIEYPSDVQREFVWQTAGQETYHALLGTFLAPPGWRVRAATFEGDVAERAEEWNAYLDGTGAVRRVRHQLPQGRPGPQLEEAAAREIAEGALRDRLGVDPSGLKDISAVSAKLPDRRDWTFTWADTTGPKLPKGECRIAVEIGGDAVTDARRFVYVPEDWERDFRSRETVTGNLDMIRSFLLVFTILTGAIFAIVWWSRRRYPARAAVAFFLAFIVTMLIRVALRWPAIESRFMTEQPFGLQRMIALVSSVGSQLIFAAVLALFAGLAHREASRGAAPSAGGGAPSAAPKPGSLPASATGLLAAVATGFTAAGLIRLLWSASRSEAPSLPDVSGAEALLPALSEAVGPLTSLVMRAAVVMAACATVSHLTKGWTWRRPLYGAALFVLGAFLGQLGGGDTPRLWLIQAVVSGLFFLLAYLLVFRHDLALVVPAAGTMAMLGEIRAAVLNTWPGAAAGAIAAFVLAGAVTVVWYRSLRRAAAPSNRSGQEVLR